MEIAIIVIGLLCIAWLVWNIKVSRSTLKDVKYTQRCVEDISNTLVIWYNRSLIVDEDHGVFIFRSQANTADNLGNITTITEDDGREIKERSRVTKTH